MIKGILITRLIVGFLILTLCYIFYFIYKFKKEKKIYLPLTNPQLTEGQKAYTLKYLRMQLLQQSFLHSNIVFQDVDEVIHMIEYDMLDECSLVDLNKFMNNININIGFIRIK